MLNEQAKIPAELILNEYHISPLVTESAKKKIKEIDIYFAYIIGFENVEEKIKSLLHEIFGFQKEKVHFFINKKFKDSEKVFSGSDSDFNHEKKKLLKEHLQLIGSQLLKNEGKKQAKIDSCKLGYAGAEALALFPYNVPTMTITALWCKGELEDGSPWIPLAPRRRRQSKGKYIGED